MRKLLLVFLIAMGALAQEIPPSGSTQPDSDGDGLPDAVEQALLQRFLPRFHVSAAECDGIPATFAPGEAAPRMTAREGVIYGKVSPAPAAAGRGRVEAHYYHLWSRDCGRLAHPLDVEHVAVLLEHHPRAAAGPAPDNTGLLRLWEWKALYWFAAGHQGTVCDVSHAAKAELLLAEWAGADVWISKGKHASYLSRDRCRLGCGGDSCPEMQLLEVPRVINLGEPGRPMNGSDWIAFAGWPLGVRMGSRFDAATIGRIEAKGATQIVAMNGVPPPVRSTVLAGGELLNSAGTGSRHTGKALKTGRNASGSALGRAFRSTKRAMGLGKSESGSRNGEAPLQ